MDTNELAKKNIYDLKNLLFKAVVTDDKKLEKQVKKAINDFFNSKL